ncbi:alpha-amylase family glycosyl hydrolase [Halonotius roseus]|uniref:Alpha-amylase n=1 Tax=Halonotius roseus TaxID=2511997 RepID=A0A544QS72_9EURY|nr:alpha-amylase family glycosyl hydrolase [Halonotius roseus]TQQ82305.1 alpha-amylase [Halonotius roseus]
MDNIGPPRFVAVGETVELAPWNPDPAAEYTWRLVDAPAESRLSVGDEAVVTVTPDQPGSYRFALAGPSGTHSQRVFAFPHTRSKMALTLPFAELPVEPATIDRVSVVGPFNDHRVGANRPRRADDRFVLEVELPPGTHHYGFCLDDDFGRQIHDSVTVLGPGRPRCALSARVDDESEQVVVTAEPTAAPDSELGDDELDVRFVVDDRDSIPDAAVDTDGRICRVAADAVDDRLRVHAVAVGERHSVADTVDVRHTETGEVEIRSPTEPPAWAESPTVYEIFVRSFAGETPQTTFSEIERRIEYLESLGVDMLWLTPILASPTDHGYHITDYFSTAADLGDRTDFASLVDRCHEAGIRVVFDLVINHTSRDHPAFQLHSAGVDGYDDRYVRVPRDDDSTDIAWAGDGSPEFYFNWSRIPNLNYGSLAVRRWILDVVDEWVDLVDGFRCDIAWGVPHGFWKEVAEGVPADFLMLDETIPHDPQYHEAEFTMHYDSTLHETLRAIGNGEEPARAIFEALETVETSGFPESAVHLRYVENHDESRYLGECGEPALRAAAAATFTLPGAPLIYYGQERGMTVDRGPMKWHDGDTELTDFHRSLSRLRDEYPVLGDGEVEQVSVGVVTTTAAMTTDTAADVVDSAGEDGENRAGDDSDTRGDPADTAADDTDATRTDDSSDTTTDDAGDSDRTKADDDADSLRITDEPQHVVAFARDNGDQRLLVVLNFGEIPATVSLPTAVGDTDLRTGNPLRKRHDPREEEEDKHYVVVDDVIVCRPVAT